MSLGGTLGNITTLLREWVRELGEDDRALMEKLRFVGITLRKRTSPTTWRWQQQLDWARNVRVRYIKDVSIPWRLWNYLGNIQAKVAQTNPPGRWGDAALADPPRGEKQLQALRLALYFYESGSERNARSDFARRLSSEPAMKHGWFRALITELRGAA